ncbi:MAG TPA: aldehyde dehydrogenase (NADP(+)) [Flavisolibacter sp.]
MRFIDATIEEVDETAGKANRAFNEYKKLDLKSRAAFLYSIAAELEMNSAQLIAVAHGETKLDEARLRIELSRTIFQLTSYADACAEGTWLDIRIDTANESRNPPKPDLRKMLVPLGPVVVFGASNFPFAYSTAGGDTACALAAGCPVIIKAHPAHAHTSELVSAAIHKASRKHQLPDGIFTHLHGAGFGIGKALVQHPFVKAVGFTGSFEGGKALFDLANQREVPIPVFAEMGSVNPVFLLPQKLQEETASMASMLAKSITQSAGQFCTNPGVLVAIDGKGLERFKTLLGEEIKKAPRQKMLHPGIAKNFHQKRQRALDEGAQLLAANDIDVNDDESIPTLASVKAQEYLNNPVLHKEVFGPYSLLVECVDENEMLAVALAMEGQLTTTLMATEEEAKEKTDLISVLIEKCGRFIFNGVPTGVEVALAMHHGGPYPATTDSRFTAVGADGIKRFARPVSFQNWPDQLLPDELKNENPLQLWRTVNNVLTREAIVSHSFDRL